MQKLGNKGSVLLWSIFLTIFMSFSFLAVSNQIGKSIDKLSLLKGMINFDSKEEKLVYSNNYNGGLKVGEDTEFRFSGTGSISVDLSVLNGGPILYKLLLINGTSFSVKGGNIDSNGLVNSSSTINFDLDSSFDTAILYIRNLGGFTNYSISSGFDFLAEKFEILEKEKIGNKEIIKKRYFETNFEKSLFSEGNFDLLDYQNYGMYNIN